MAKKSKKEHVSFRVDFSEVEKALATIVVCQDRARRTSEIAHKLAAKYFDPNKMATRDKHRELMCDILSFPQGCDIEESPE